LAGNGRAALKALDAATFSLLDMLAFDPLSAVGTLDPRLTVHALRSFCALNALTIDALRTFRTLDLLTLDALRALGALNLLTLHALGAFDPLDALACGALRTFGARDTLRTLHPLALSPLRAFGALDGLALRALRTLGALASLCLAFAAILAGLCAAFTFVAFTFGTYRAGQRHGGDTSNQEKLASHYNLLAQSNVMNINFRPYELCLCGA